MIDSIARSVSYSKKFLKSSKRLPARILQEAGVKEKIFRDNPFDTHLKTHKLSGKEKGTWAFWINDSYRIKFMFLPSKEILFLDIGTHEIYK